MAKTYTEQLESVQAAIEAIELRGQTVTINNRTLGRAELPALYRREVRLRRLVDRATRGGVRVMTVVPE